jgi:hypothetical protein
MRICKTVIVNLSHGAEIIVQKIGETFIISYNPISLNAQRVPVMHVMHVCASSYRHMSQCITKLL